MTQFQLNFESSESAEPSLPNARLRVPEPDIRYGSVKRVFLVYEGSLQDLPCITSTEEAKRLFKNYWKLHPAHDQEQFVVACLDTKHRVQCIVRVNFSIPCEQADRRSSKESFRFTLSARGSAIRLGLLKGAICL